MLAIDVLSRIIHVTTAITLVGGSIFMLWVLMPAAAKLPEDVHRSLADDIRGRWKRFVHLGILLFLVSGGYNYYQGMQLHDGDGLYHALVGTKILLALVVFFIASALVGRSTKLQPMRDAKEKWLKVLVTIALLIVFMSGFVKIRGVPDSAAEAVDSADSSEAAGEPVGDQ